MLKPPLRKLRNPVARMREQWEGQAQRVSGSLRTLGQKPRRPPEALPAVLGGGFGDSPAARCPRSKAGLAEGKALGRVTL